MENGEDVGVCVLLTYWLNYWRNPENADECNFKCTVEKELA